VVALEHVWVGVTAHRHRDCFGHARVDEEQKITRPKQIYIGYGERSYVPLGQRRDGGALEPEVCGPL